MPMQQYMLCVTPRQSLLNHRTFDFCQMWVRTGLVHRGIAVRKNKTEMKNIREYLKYCWDTLSFSSAANEPIRLRLVSS